MALQTEERTYSVKSPPATASTSSYSIKSLLKRACRFLGHARQEDKTMPGAVGICCWKVNIMGGGLSSSTILFYFDKKSE